jgi:hypothetical protein
MCCSCNTRTVLVRPAISRPAKTRISKTIRASPARACRFHSAPFEGAVALGGATRLNKGGPAVSLAALVTVRRRGTSGRRGRFPHAPARQRMA